MPISGNSASRGLREPIERLIKQNQKDGAIIVANRTPNETKETIIDRFKEQTLNEFGGLNVQLIYDGEDKLIMVKSEGCDTTLHYSTTDRFELEHIEDRIAGQKEKDPYIRTTLDYSNDKKRQLQNVNTELIE